MAEQITISNIKLDDVISFTTYGVGTINNVVNGTVLSVVSGTYLKDPVTAASEHINLYPSLPVINGTPVPNNFNAYNYVILKLPNNSIIEVGMPWINEVTLSRLQRKTVTITINDFDTDDLIALNELLTMRGYLNRTITVS